MLSAWSVTPLATNSMLNKWGGLKAVLPVDHRIHTSNVARDTVVRQASPETRGAFQVDSLVKGPSGVLPYTTSQGT